MQNEEDKDEVLENAEKEENNQVKDTEHTVNNCMKLLVVLILCTIILNIYRANIWHLYFSVKSESADNNGVKHYVIHDADNDVDFNYICGKYKEPLFTDDDGTGHWYHTVHVKESDYIARVLYSKKEQIFEMFDALSVDYKIDSDNVEQTIIGFEVYLDEKDDEVIDALMDMSKTMSDWIRDVEPFVPASDRDCGNIKVFDADREYPFKTIHLNLRYY